MPHAQSRACPLRWIGRGALVPLAAVIALGVQPAPPALAGSWSAFQLPGACGSLADLKIAPGHAVMLAAGAVSAEIAKWPHVAGASCRSRHGATYIATPSSTPRMRHPSAVPVRGLIRATRPMSSPPLHEEDMMRKTVAAIALAGSLLTGVATAAPALAQSPPINLLCSPSTNGGTLVDGVCVLPAATVGQPYEAFLLTSNGAVDTFTITKGSLPPGLSMPATYGVAGTIVGGTPTKRGTFSFTVHVTPFGASTPSANGTYSITVRHRPR